jgi:hypothetical protein
MNSAPKTKLAWVAATVGSVVLAGSVATASAHHGNNNDQGDDNNGDHGYAKEQCMNGGWKNFTNPDGSQKFKNQGQCIKFFNHNGNDNNNGSGDNNDDQGNHNGHGNSGQQGSSGFHFGTDMNAWLSNLFSWLGHLFGGA